ncbi:MAG: hypothetical protein IKZ01_00055 [Anaerotignum sp.]|nr:hypothetical protein [Anaerotignum sp.]
MKKLKKVMKRNCLKSAVNEILFSRPNWCASMVEKTISEYLDNYEYDPADYEFASDIQLMSDVVADCRMHMNVFY